MARLRKGVGGPRFRESCERFSCTCFYIRYHGLLELFCPRHNRGLFVVLTALRACNNWEKAEEILSMMKSRAIKPNEVTYTELISICGRSGDVHQALVSKLANPLEHQASSTRKSAHWVTVTRVFPIFGTSFIQLFFVFARVNSILKRLCPQHFITTRTGAFEAGGDNLWG